MLGNWSLGDYFKKEAISWSWEFLTSPNGWASTRTASPSPCSPATRTARATRRRPISGARWASRTTTSSTCPRRTTGRGPAGLTGPCGPDTEMFIITDKEPCGPDCSPACSCGRYLEIWNDVFMQYDKQADGSFKPLKQKNVDTGMGLEAHYCVLMGREVCLRDGHLRRHPCQDRRIERQDLRRKRGSDQVPSASSPTTCAPPRSSSATTAA